MESFHRGCDGPMMNLDLDPLSCDVPHSSLYTPSVYVGLQKHFSPFISFPWQENGFLISSHDFGEALGVNKKELYKCTNVMARLEMILIDRLF